MGCTCICKSQGASAFSLTFTGRGRLKPVSSCPGRAPWVFENVSRDEMSRQGTQKELHQRDRSLQRQLWWHSGCWHLSPLWIHPQPLFTVSVSLLHSVTDRGKCVRFVCRGVCKGRALLSRKMDWSSQVEFRVYDTASLRRSMHFVVRFSSAPKGAFHLRH